MSVRDGIGLALVELLGPPIFRTMCSTLRFQVEGREHQARVWREDSPVVFITWHGRLLPLLYLYRGAGLVMLVSRHRDGEYLTRLGMRLGYRAVRGSSTRGGYGALRALVRQVRRGRSLAITPDGPLGPREELKPGALQVSRITGAPVVPVMAGARRAWWIEGWDRFLIPKPFATVRVAIGQPQYIPANMSVSDLEILAGQLQTSLQALKTQVDGPEPVT